MRSLGRVGWAAIGLLLTIVGSFVEVYVPTWPWEWGEVARVQAIGTRYQVAAVLLTGCLGGREAAVIAQIAYVILGLAGLPLFEGGGGWAYWSEPRMGYLLGFIPGGWYCGHLAFWRSRAARRARRPPPPPPRLEWLVWSAMGGLVVIHLVGLLWAAISRTSDWGAIAQAYTVRLLPAHLISICIVAVVASILRRLLLYR